MGGMEPWRVLHTPGHAWGHVCLFEESTGAIVVGDMVASIGTILIAPGDGDMRIYIEQLERLASLDTKVALPAHGDPIDDPAAHFRKYIAHRLLREVKVMTALAQHGSLGVSLSALVVDAYDDTPAHVWPVAMLSLAAHLQKLAYEGRAVENDGVWIARRN